MNLLQVIKVRRIRDNYYTSVNTIRETMAEKKGREHPTRAKAEKKGINIAKKKKLSRLILHSLLFELLLHRTHYERACQNHRFRRPTKDKEAEDKQGARERRTVS